MLLQKSCRVERIKLVVNTNRINTYKSLQISHSASSIHLSFPFGTVKPCFLSEKVTRADPRTVRFDKMLNFWAALVIRIFYILSEKSGQQFTIFESLSKYFCIHNLYIVKNSKNFIIIRLSTTPCNFM